MTFLPKKIILIIIILFSAVLCVQAEEEGKNEKKFYSSSTSFSLLMTSGNAKDLTLGFDTEQNLSFIKSHLQFKGSVIYSESDGSKDSEFYYSHLQYKRVLSPKAYIVGLGRFERNVLSGYNYRFALSVGAGYQWKKSEKMELSSEAAFGWSQESNIKKNGDENISLTFVSFLISNRFKISISKTSELSLDEIFFLNLDDTEDYRISSLASISVNISRYLALKTSYQIKYNHRPVPGFKSTDQYLISSLVLSF